MTSVSPKMFNRANAQCHKTISAVKYLSYTLIATVLKLQNVNYLNLFFYSLKRHGSHVILLDLLWFDCYWGPLV